MRSLASSLFTRAIAAIFFFAFLSLIFQVKGLYGSYGITPIIDSWLLANDLLLEAFSYLGAIVAILLYALPFFYKNKFNNLIEGLLLLTLFFIYREYLIHGNVFMSFQWDILLLEVGFWGALYCFFKNNQDAAEIFTWIFRFMIFKLMLMSGLVKLNSNDPSWANLSALNYHYYTQPIPNPISFLIQQLPQAFHRISCAIMFVIELLVPFFIFGTKQLRLIAAILFILLQLVIISTGNYCFFNLLTIALCLWLIDDEYIVKFIPNALNQKLTITKLSKPENIISQIIDSRLEKLQHTKFQINKICVLALAVFYIGTSSLYIVATLPFNFALKNLSARLSHEIISKTRLLLPSSPYGLFAIMTTKRYEIIIQGLADEKSSWKDYEFYYKPGNTRRFPPQVAPYQPRLDWQMWFAALSNYQQNPWLINLAFRLLQNQKEVTNLLEYNPFPHEPPKFIRAVAYEYKFNTLSGFLDGGEVWLREPVGVYLPEMSLRQ